MNIPLIIREVLLRNEQLVIPGLGTFRVVQKPAQINKATRLLTPPSKEIIFDDKQKSDDNQLILSVKKKLGLSEAETDDMLDKYLLQLKDDIRNNGKASLEGLGEFSLDNSGKLNFKPQGDLLNLTGVFALPELDIPASAVVDDVSHVTGKPAEPVVAAARKGKKWLIPVAVVLFLGIAASLAYFTGILDNIKVRREPAGNMKEEAAQPDRMVFGKRNTTENDTLKDAISRQLDERNKRDALRVEEKPNQTEDSTPPDITPAREISPAGLYHIISGSFMAMENAEKQQSLLREKGLDPQILPRKGKYYMVSLGSFASSQEAAITMEKLRDKLRQDLWVMKISNE